MTGMNFASQSVLQSVWCSVVKQLILHGHLCATVSLNALLVTFLAP